MELTYKIDTLFNDMSVMMTNLKKSTYEMYMDKFRAENKIFLSEITEYVEMAEDKPVAAIEIATDFTQKVKEKFTVKGKIKKTLQVDINMFVVYYILTAIILTKSPDADLIDNAICMAWRKSFKNGNIRYTTYDEIYNSFNEKQFGIF